MAHAQSNYATPYFFTTLAGAAGVPGTSDGTGAAARFRSPHGLAADRDGNIYVADTGNHAIRKITPDGTVTTFAGRPGTAGYADGAGITARFQEPTGVAVDAGGNVLVVESASSHVRRIAPDGEVTTIATVPQVFLRGNYGVTVDGSGDAIVSVIDNSVRRVARDGTVTMLISSPDLAGWFDWMPFGVAAGPGGAIFIADPWSSRIHKLTPAGIETWAGTGVDTGDTDGAGTTARFLAPYGLASDAAGNLYVADTENCTIRMISPSAVVTTLAGRTEVAGALDGRGSAARFRYPRGVAVTVGGTVFVADTDNHTIRRSVFAPEFTAHLANQSVAAGGTATFHVSVESDAPVDLQWMRDGAEIPGATAATLTIDSVQASDLGHYTVRASNAAGSIVSNPASLSLAAANADALMNLSIRGHSGPGAESLVVGFVIDGTDTTATKPLLIRGAGPALEPFGVPGILADPKLTVFSGSSPIASNDDWEGHPQVSAVGAQVGAFPFASTTSRDAALHHGGLGTGVYSIHVNGHGDAAGVVLAEIYDATPPNAFTDATPRLVNMSVRGRAGTDTAILIAGFNIGGTSNRTLLIRAIGPSLDAFGVPGALADPRLALFRGPTLLESNDDWAGAAPVSAAAAHVGAFPLAADSRDAVLLVSLPPGGYTAHVSGAASSTGVALLELYDVP